MAKTIEQGFREFLVKLTPSTTESAAVSSHRASIEACLKSNFGLARFARIGSYGNGTSVSGFSDVDYLACLPAGQLTTNSGYSLTKVRNALNARFPRTGVRVDCPAVCIPFGTSTASYTEVVIAYYIEERNGYKVYGIPDCDSGWMRASPDAHNAYVRSLDAGLAGKVKPLIRFLKAWKYYNNVPISSFYLELRTAKFASSQKSISYGASLKYLFKTLHENDLPRLQDPKGISGYISPCHTASQKVTAISKLATATARATKAWDAALAGKTGDAFYWWDLLFGGTFPTY